jgi:hypothetical protein
MLGNFPVATQLLAMPIVLSSRELDILGKKELLRRSKYAEMKRY